VAYSERVRRELRELLEREVARGKGREALEAARRIDETLQIYPQFGEPLRELSTEQETVWVGTVPPLVVQYVIDERHSVVFIVAPFRLLPAHDG
jgi:hypothetical protein